MVGGRGLRDHLEHVVEPVRTGAIFTDYTVGPTIYDYDVAFLGLSPYVHAEATPLESLRVTAGLRFDRLGFDYENHLGPLDTGTHRRPESGSVSYTELSPHLGAAYDLGFASVFASYGQGFRAPSEGQLFRQGVAVNTIDLKPVEATNCPIKSQRETPSYAPDFHCATTCLPNVSTSTRELAHPTQSTASIVSPEVVQQSCRWL